MRTINVPEIVTAVGLNYFIRELCLSGYKEHFSTEYNAYLVDLAHDGLKSRKTCGQEETSESHRRLPIVSQRQQMSCCISAGNDDNVVAGIVLSTVVVVAINGDNAAYFGSQLLILLGATIANLLVGYLMSDCLILGNNVVICYRRRHHGMNQQPRG